MAKFKLKLPKMGESVAEATITSWLKEIGDTIEIDEPILEIATDKVDSEVPSEVEGVLVERFFNVDDVVQVGGVLAIIETEGDANDISENDDAITENVIQEAPQQEAISYVEETVAVAQQAVETPVVVSTDNRFYSPLVKNIAKTEGITQEELDTIPGTGKDARVTKSDILQFLENRNGNGVIAPAKIDPVPVPVKTVQEPVKVQKTPVISNGEDEIIEMTRMGKLVSNHMTSSLQTSAHVQSFIEADVTNIWNWRKKVKDAFFKREGENLTFTPIFMEAVAKALREYPLMNISVQDDKIIKKKNINLGMAAALPDGNLIVPVIKNADQLNLVGMTKQVNDLANRARLNQLKPDEIQGGTYTVTNVGSFGSIMGTPIINQPQVGILALGAIRKVPAVIETPEGDFIGIRYKMFLSHSYDHRVVNGALGGMFVKAVADYLEAWDIKREI
ncbi:2-oxo acid dehydrogenase subunit E2 [Tamlana sp. 62-3]|uniref:Dihydrolipoamide acetyltransferase component of pyruvate dehydrogenase complex n=1 Tax=Neotamlana sargassicola TaxID=2883125 RepID=A0A9X1L834_9FLAO|nr:dihydrolipoamide acetyltransferase family protein [Tamlana sargassicola]MCB4809481.1 2-oxo acid dehydrogenase subunit E2 [Tamlana sargassicola]